MLEAVLEEAAIGEPTQRVMEGLMLQLLLEIRALTHVPQGEDDTFEGRLTEQVGRCHLDVKPRTVTVPDQPLCRDRGSRSRRHARVSGQCLLDIVGMEQSGEPPALEGAVWVPEDSTCGRSLISDRRVGTGDQDDIRRILHESLEASFTATRVERLGHGLAANGHCCLRGEDLDRTSKLEGELGGTCNNYQTLQLVFGDEWADELFGQLMRCRAGMQAGRLDDIALPVAIGQALPRVGPESRQAERPFCRVRSEERRVGTEC